MTLPHTRPVQSSRRISRAARVASVVLAWSLPISGQSACPTDEGAGSLVGILYDDTRTLGLPGVDVSIRGAGSALSVTTGPDGAFAACSLPAEEELIASASFGGMSSAVLRFTLQRGQILEHEFLIGMSGAADETGRVLGTVVDGGSGEPVDGAVVGLAGAAGQAVTSATGAFMLDNVPAGETTIDVQHLAYGTQSASVSVRPGASTSLLIRVTPEPVELEPLEVTVEGVRYTNLETRGFYDRQQWSEKSGLGHFLTIEDIERRAPRLVSHMIANVPGTRLDCTDSVMSQRCELFFVGIPRTIGCQRADIFLDGVNVIKSDQAFNPHSIDEMVRPLDIAGIEVYPGPSSVPAEFSGASGSCGAIVIWTR